MPVIRFGVVSLFPNWVQSLDEDGVIGRALRQGLVSLEVENPRDHAVDKHRTVDDRPYGGGPGMVLMPEPMDRAIAVLKARLPTAPIIYMSPQGERLTQHLVDELRVLPELILIAGRYEGLDERIVDKWVDREISIGDFVVSGGELPAMLLIDAVTRWVPGALGHADSAAQDSFATGLLDCPHYTRPEVFEGRTVPPVLLSGDHAKIRQWREAQAQLRTTLRRPDMLAKGEHYGSKKG